MQQTGQGISRLEGSAKVTGAAQYAGDYHVPGLLYGYIVSASITRGRIVGFDTAAVEALPGVVKVFTHENRPSLAWFDLQYADMDAPQGSPFRPLRNAEVVFNGQPIALVVAETFEQARYGASVLHVLYEEEAGITDLRAHIAEARKPKPGLASLLKPPPPKLKGEMAAVYNTASYTASGVFMHGTEHHNPMELPATTTVYEGKGKLRIYDKTQGTVNVQMYVGNVFGLKYKQVQVVSPYVGGAFGSGLRPQFPLFFSVMAALELKRAVRVTLDRQQAFFFAHRPPTLQRTQFAADADGKLTGISHEAYAETSRYEDYTEVVVDWGARVYPVANHALHHLLVPLDVYTPMDMRAPGGATGLHAIEVTMDELAYELNMDPLELRLRNYSLVDGVDEKPYTSKELKACYEQGAEQFGWYTRNPRPRSMQRGHQLVGYGMATGIWDNIQFPARASMELQTNGQLLVRSAITDIGTGTLTVMTQIAADELGLRWEDVQFEYGDSKLPLAPIQGGSATVSSVGAAIATAGKALRKQLLAIAQAQYIALKDAKLKEVVFAEGNLTYRNFTVSLQHLLSLHGKPVHTTNTGMPKVLKLRKYSRAVHSAAFVEVAVDEELGIVQVTRALTAVAAGRIINPKTARSQVLGGMVWGISKALREETLTDHRLGRYMNTNLAEYHLPVHADIHELDVLFVKEEDRVINELGTKGVGEIGIVAMPAAISNAIYHATGKRLYDLPMHLEQLL